MKERYSALTNSVCLFTVSMEPGGRHLFTVDVAEVSRKVQEGWILEGIGWYAVSSMTEKSDAPVTIYQGTDYASVYDFHDYIAYKPDVYAAYGMDDQAAREHFVRYGISEGRKAREGIDSRGSEVSDLLLKEAGYRTRDLLDGVPGTGFSGIGGYQLDADERDVLESGIQAVGTNCSFVMVDLKSGKGAAYNIDVPFYSASSIKGPYMAALSKYADAHVSGYDGHMYVSYSARDLARM